VTTLAKPKLAIARTNRGSGHGYTIDGRKVPGVTTILGTVVAKPALVGWASKLVAEYVADKDALWLEELRADGRDALVAHLKGVPNRAKTAAGVRGTQVHAYAERVIAGEELEETPELEPLWGHIESCVAFLDAWEISPVLVEAVVGSREHRYCGTADLVADSGRLRQRGLYDYKTSASGIWPETALQLAAYLHAESYVDGTRGPEFTPTEEPFAGLGIEAAYAVHLRGDGYDVYPVETAASWEAFTHLAAAYHLGVGASPRDGGGWTSWIREAVQL
jgi:hypothetical protein